VQHVPCLKNDKIFVVVSSSSSKSQDKNSRQKRQKLIDVEKNNVLVDLA